MDSRRGFTLVELVIYSAVLAIVGGILTGVLVTSIRTQNRDTTSNEVAQQLDLVLSTTQRLVREASLIDFVYEGVATGTACSQYCSLQLRMATSSIDPTIIRSDATGVYLKEGSAAEVPLTTNAIIVNNFKFTKFEVAGGHASVQVDATFSSNTSNQQLAVTKSLQTAISRVSASTFDSDLLPNLNDAWDLGQISPDKRWQNLFLSDNLIVGGNSTISGSEYITGNLGIGTTNPLGRIHIKRASSDPDILTWLDINNSASNAAYLRLTETNYRGGFLRYDNVTNNFHIGVHNTDDTVTSSDILALTIIRSTGNVGIGTTAPNAKLTVGTEIAGSVLSPTFITNAGALGGTAGNSLNLANIGFTSGNNSSLGIRALRTVSGGSWDTTALGLGMSVDNTVWDTNTIWLNANGNVGVGKTNPGTKLDVNGAITATAYYYSSDISLKTGIKPLLGALEKLLGLEGVEYAWKDTGKKEIGLIAQDVEKIFPEFVNTNEETGLKSVDYAKLTVPLIEAVKEQQMEIDALREEINLLKKDIEDLKTDD